MEHLICLELLEFENDDSFDFFLQLMKRAFLILIIQMLADNKSSPVFKTATARSNKIKLDRNIWISTRKRQALSC